MKKLFAIGSLLFLVCLTSACQRQVQTASDSEKPLPGEKTPIKKAPVVKPPPSDIDPFFQRTKKLNSPYGPTRITRNILEDKAGNIWFATWEGIVRYDGSSFTNLTNKEGLRGYRTFSILEDQKGIIWFGTIGAGLYRYDASEVRNGKSGFTNLTTENGLVNNDIQCMYEDQKGNLWLGTRNGLSCYDGHTFRNFTKEDGLPDADLNSIIEDESGNLWLGARGEASVYDGQKFTRLLREGGQNFINVRSIIKDKKGNIWLGGNDGLWYYEDKTFVKLDPDFIGYLFEDSQGNLWVSKSTPDNSYQMGLYHYDAQQLPPTPTTASNQIANPQGQVFGITEDSKGNIWFGTERGAGRFDGVTFEYFRDHSTDE